MQTESQLKCKCLLSSMKASWRKKGINAVTLGLNFCIFKYFINQMINWDNIRQIEIVILIIFKNKPSQNGNIKKLRQKKKTILQNMSWNFSSSFSEKHQDGHWARQNICHHVLRHFLQAEAPGGKDAGGVQGGAGVPATAALRHPREAGRGGSGRLRPTQRKITSGDKQAVTCAHALSSNQCRS